MSVTEIQARIATVQAQFVPSAALAPAAPAGAASTGAALAGGGSTPSFDELLTEALGAPTTIGAMRQTFAGALMSGGSTLGGPSQVSPLVGAGLLGAGPRMVASTRALSTLPPLQPGADWAARLPDAARPYLGAIQQAAEAAGVDPRIVAAVTWAESAFRPDAVSGAGAVGLMQLMPGTARGLGVDPHDPMQNIEGGARYLAEQLERFGRLDHALAAYNAGPGAVQRHGGIPPYEETRNYVARVTSYVQQLSQEAS